MASSQYPKDNDINIHSGEASARISGVCHCRHGSGQLSVSDRRAASRLRMDARGATLNWQLFFLTLGVGGGGATRKQGHRGKNFNRLFGRNCEFHNFHSILSCWTKGGINEFYSIYRRGFAGIGQLFEVYSVRQVTSYVVYSCCAKPWFLRRRNTDFILLKPSQGNYESSHECWRERQQLSKGFNVEVLETRILQSLPLDCPLSPGFRYFVSSARP